MPTPHHTHSAQSGSLLPTAQVFSCTVIVFELCSPYPSYPACKYLYSTTRRLDRAKAARLPGCQRPVHRYCTNYRNLVSTVQYSTVQYRLPCTRRVRKQSHGSWMAWCGPPHDADSLDQSQHPRGLTPSALVVPAQCALNVQRNQKLVRLER